MTTPEKAAKTPFPPAPWRLEGKAYGTVWLLKSEPERRHFPPDVHLIKILGRWIAITFWVEYMEGSTLSYSEFLLAVIGRIGRRICATTTHIWVDSPVSKEAGNVMWGIPKELAKFTFDHQRGTTEMQLTDLAAIQAKSTKKLRIPGRLPIRLLLAQPLDGRLRLINIRATAHVELSTSEFTDADKAIPALHSARPVLHVRLTHFKSRFDV